MARRFIDERRPTAGRSVRQPTKGRLPTVIDEDITLAEALDHFVRAKEAEGCRERTLKEYRLHIGYLTEYMGKKGDAGGASPILLSEVTPTVIRDYINYLLRDRTAYEGDEYRKKVKVGLSPNTVNIRLRTLKTMCRFWYAEGYASINAMELIKPVRADHVEEVQGLADEDIERILNYYDERKFSEWRDKTLVLLLLDTGMRIQEAVSLSPQQIDHRNNSILVPSEVAKNRKYRDVPVSRDVVKRLFELYDECRQYFGAIDRIFMNAYGEEYTAEAFRKRLTRLKPKVGLEKLHPHQFRHTFARNYLLGGGDLFTLQKILDHADIKTTRKYIQMTNEDVRMQHTKFSPVRKYMKRK